jgi:hypothetical protein
MIREQGKDILEDPAVFMQNLDWIKDLVERSMAQKAASMNPEIRENYNAQFEQVRGNRENLINPLEWQPERLSFADETKTDLQTLGNNKFAEPTKLPFGLGPDVSLEDLSIEDLRKMAGKD